MKINIVRRFLPRIGHMAATLGIAVTVMPACSKADLHENTPILLQASSIMTRAYTTGCVDSEEEMRDGSFGAVGYSQNTIVFGDADKGISQSYSNNRWGYTNSAEVQSWENDTEKINFYAYFPYSVTASFAASDASGDVMTLTGWTDGADVMYARATDCTLAKQKASDGTPLVFDHAFTKIESIHITVPNSSPLSFYVAGVEITDSHCETDGKVILGTTGDATCVNGTAQTRSIAFSGEKAVSRSDASGIDLISSEDNFFFFPVTSTSDIWDGKTKGTDICKSKMAIHLTAKVKQNSDGEYVLGSASDYADIYLPLKSTSNGSQIFERGKRYTVNFTLAKGVGYDENGDTYKPIEITVAVDEWKENEISVGQITVNTSEVTLASGESSDSSVIINASDASQLTATVTEGSDKIEASIQQDTDILKKIRLVITKKSGAMSGSAKVLINDQATNSMVTINVTIN